MSVAGVVTAQTPARSCERPNKKRIRNVAANEDQRRMITRRAIGRTKREALFDDDRRSALRSRKETAGRRKTVRAIRPAALAITPKRDKPRMWQSPANAARPVNAEGSKNLMRGARQHLRRERASAKNRAG